MRSGRVERFASIEALTAALAEIVRRETDADLATYGRATLVLSGGSTPPRYLQAVAAARPDWHGVTVTLSDERFVPVDHADSNEGMARTHFAGTGADFVSLRGSAEPVETAAKEAGDRLAACHWPAAVSLLGFGPDGHTASLFNANDTARQDGPCIATRQPKDGSARISMTFEQLLQARSILMIAGPDKAGMLEALAAGEPAADSPIAQLRDRAGARLRWVGFTT
jgi:6-phosphogluconolactonase